MQSVTQAFGYTLRKYSGLTLVLTGFTECRVSEPIHMLYSVGVQCAEGGFFNRRVTHALAVHCSK